MVVTYALVCLPLIIWSPLLHKQWQEQETIGDLTTVRICLENYRNSSSSSSSSSNNNNNNTNQTALTTFVTGSEPLVTLCEKARCPSRVRLCAAGERPLELYSQRVAPVLTAAVPITIVWLGLARLFYRDLWRVVRAEEEEEEEQEENEAGDDEKEQEREGRLGGNNNVPKQCCMKKKIAESETPATNTASRISRSSEKNCSKNRTVLLVDNAKNVHKLK